MNQSGFPTTVLEQMKFPHYCYNCGKPYLWTEKLIGAVRTVVNDSPDLDPEEKAILPSLIETAVIRNGPDAPDAVAKAGLLVKKLRGPALDILKKVMGEVCSEYAKRTLFP